VLTATDPFEPSDPSDPFDAAFRADPQAGWDRLREQAAVHRVVTPEGPPAWLVTRAADVRAGLLDPRLSVDKRRSGGHDYQGFALPPELDSHLLNREGADHARLRRLIAPALTPHRIESLRGRIEAITTTLLDQLEELDGEPGARVDLVADYAVPLPLRVVGELLGVPAPEAAELEAWAGALLAPAAGPAPRARDQLATMARIVGGLIVAKQRAPGDDLTSALLGADADGERLSPHELTSMLFYLIFVWYEVAVDLMANGLLELLRRPHERAALAADPTRLPGAVEELLRYLTPQSLATPRFAVTDVEIAGTPIPAGDTVLLVLAAADHDPAAFPDPGRLDPGRDASGQLSFGAGLHRCIGAPLVRLQTEVAVGGLLRRFPALRPAFAEPDLRWREGFRHRGVRELPVTL
jgi:cytochrome P450